MKKKGIYFVLVLAITFSSLQSLPIHVWAAADTCSWTGATSADWSDGTNWSGCDNGGVPESGDTLVFPAVASNKTMNNDIVGLTTDNIGVGGSGYTFGGNAFTISGASAFDATASVVVNAPVTFSGFNAVIAATSGNTITFNDVTTFSSGGGEVNVGTTGSYDGTVDFVGNIVGSAATQFVAVEGARAIVRGAANTFSAGTVGAESGASFECRSTTCFGAATNDIYAGGGVVYLYSVATYTNNIVTSAVTPGVSAVYSYEDVTLSGDTTINDSLYFGVTASGKTLTVDGNVSLAGQDLQVSSVDRTGHVIITGIVSGAQGIATYSTHLTLAGANTYTGATYANSGAATITVQDSSALGAASSGTFIGNGDVLEIDLPAPGTIDEPLSVEGTGYAGSGAVVFTGDSVTMNGDIALNSSTTLSIDSAIDGQPTLQGEISGAYNITYQQDAGLYGFIVNSGNTYTGTTTVLGTFVRAAATNAIPSQDVYVNATPSSDAELQYFSNDLAPDTQRVHTANNGANVAYVTFTADETVAQVDGDGDIEVLGTNVLGSNSSYSFSGNLSFNLGTSTLRKTGSGTATLSGTASAPIGSTPLVQVNGGTVIANGTYAPVAFEVNAGSTLKGNGTLGATTVNAGGTLATGTSPGCITSGALTLSAGSTFEQEITGTAACSQYDRTTVNGAVTLSGATLQVNQLAGFNPAANLVFTIIDGTSLSGTFAGLTDGAVFDVNGVKYRINYYASGEVTLTVVTSPATASTPTSTLANTGSPIALISAASITLLAAAAITLGFRRRAAATVHASTK
ncbi:hypothetical protein JNM87_04525 [Candidatus Saccharibacteria bacterium]|nr:hypothetical protein [Candidatus Saccharibacteria bacterium]